MYPFMLRRGEFLSSHRAFEIVAEFCRAEGIRCFDAEPAFLADWNGDMRVSPHDYHANERAHGIFAAAVAGWLENEGLLEKNR